MWIYWLKPVRERIHPLILLPPSSAPPYPPIRSRVINLPVIREMHWHLSIKWHLIYALFMPHLCAQVLQLFIKCPLLCQNMEIESSYSWYLQQTHQWTGSHRGPPLTVAKKSVVEEAVQQDKGHFSTCSREKIQKNSFSFQKSRCSILGWNLYCLIVYSVSADVCMTSLNDE